MIPLHTQGPSLRGVEHDHIMATGYGRHLFEISFDAPTVTEIKADAVGARVLFPEVQTILDIGEQDSKAIALNGEGKVIIIRDERPMCSRNGIISGNHGPGPWLRPGSLKKEDKHD